MKAKIGFPKVKKVKRSTLKNKCDKLFRDVIRRKGYCELKGMDKVKCSGDLQTMHIVGRANYRLRWEEDNALCGCSGHHFYYTNNPFFFYELVESEFPDKWDFIIEHKNEIWDKDYEAIIKRLS
jgi:hypothetical protein